MEVSFELRNSTGTRVSMVVQTHNLIMSVLIQYDGLELLTVYIICISNQCRLYVVLVMRIYRFVLTEQFCSLLALYVTIECLSNSKNKKTHLLLKRTKMSSNPTMI